MFIHGVDGNPLASFCDALGIEYESTGFDVTSVFDAVSGGPLEGSSMELALATRNFEDQLEDLAAALPPDASMRDGIQAHLESADELSEDQRRSASFALTQLLLEINESGPADMMCLRAYADSPYEEFEGDNHVLRGGA